MAQWSIVVKVEDEHGAALAVSEWHTDKHAPEPTNADREELADIVDRAWSDIMRVLNRRMNDR